MKTPRFDFHAPETLEEALALLAEHGDEAKLLAGGQSLVPLLAMRLARPAQLIDLGGIASLRSLEAVDGHVAIGAMVREREAERSALVGEAVPVLAEALPHIGHVAIRNRGTVGGSIAHADASAELPAVAIATQARMVLRKASG
ncbi:MAG: xanthine dehydrogenase family protein subunit M, partial [Acidimicrobiia bacterium]